MTDVMRNGTYRNFKSDICGATVGQYGSHTYYHSSSQQYHQKHGVNEKGTSGSDEKGSRKCVG